MKKLLLLFFVALSSVLFAGAQVSKTQVFVASQDFVKEKLNYPKESSFRNDYICEDDGFRKYILLAKFTSKNAFGIKSEYVYKIWIQYQGGEWSDKRNWSYSKMILEDVNTRKQSIFHGQTSK